MGKRKGKMGERRENMGKRRGIRSAQYAWLSTRIWMRVLHTCMTMFDPKQPLESREDINDAEQQLEVGYVIVKS